MSPIWQDSLGFSRRVEAVTRIKAAIIVNGSTRDAAAAQTRAVKREDEAYRQSASLSAYEHAVLAHVARLEEVPMRGHALTTAMDESQVDLLISGGITIGDYMNAQEWRNGVTSTVYKARAPESMNTIDLNGSPDRIVALKVIHLQSIQPPHNADREVRLLRRAQSPNVISLHESFRDGEDLVLVLPFMPIDMAEHIRKAALSSSRKKRCVREILSGLAFVHGQGIIHRDIKLSNILLKTPTGPSYIADFGIAWASDDIASEPWDEKILDVGTTCYRPPELLFGNQKYDASLDLWAMGCVVAQILCLGSQTLFDSGDLGSDLALIKSIFETLGTPTEVTWPEVVTFPDWGKMAFTEYAGKKWTEVLPDCDDGVRDLVASLVQYESTRRTSAKQALEHRCLTITPS